MKLVKADLVYLKWSLSALAAALVIGAIVAGGGFHFRQGAEKQNRIAANLRNESQTRLASAAREEQELRDKIARFNALQQDGQVGTENRLDWIELLAQLGREHKLYDFQYEFEPQRPVDPLLIPTGSSAGAHRFLGSAQRFRGKVLHEDDLLRFLAAVRRQAKAYIVIRECRIERMPPDPAERGLAPHLTAECRLDWITLQEAR